MLYQSNSQILRYSVFIDYDATIPIVAQPRTVEPTLIHKLGTTGMLIARTIIIHLLSVKIELSDQLLQTFRVTLI